MNILLLLLLLLLLLSFLLYVQCRFGVFPCISLPLFFFARGPGCKACETLLAEGRELSSTVAMLKETVESWTERCCWNAKLQVDPTGRVLGRIFNKRPSKKTGKSAKHLSTWWRWCWFFAVLSPQEQCENLEAETLERRSNLMWTCSIIWAFSVAFRFSCRSETERAYGIENIIVVFKGNPCKIQISLWASGNDKGWSQGSSLSFAIFLTPFGVKQSLSPLWVNITYLVFEVDIWMGYL